ncbi:MAG TPA: DUF6298 domain-containing protein [Verrucomicrobiae bacterium]|jgi:hypothetical protein
MRVKLISALLTTVLALNAMGKGPSPIISTGADGRLAYEADQEGNRVPDFSTCGYAGGDRQIPDAPVCVVVPPVSGDETSRIQKAIDYVAALPPDTNGIRGAVLLLAGRHEVFGQLEMTNSGVVLRGQGAGTNGTILVAAGTSRRTFIRIAGEGDPATGSNPRWQIASNYIPVGATSIQLQDAGGLKAGDTIFITRPGTKEWINTLGMTDFGGGLNDWRLVWRPNSYDIVWDRTIEKVENDCVTIDSPITTAIDSNFGGGTLQTYSWPGRVEDVGIENLRMESTFDAQNPKDEDHSWFAITMENTANAWVRQAVFAHFAGSSVAIYESCKSVTVEDCSSLAPVSEDGGGRRNTFFTMGQQTLFLRCTAEHGRHDFSVGHCAAGPNAFVDCEADLPTADSGAIEGWASGTLFDSVRIDGNRLDLMNRGGDDEGAGWSAANSVLWNCIAAKIACENPPGAQNWAFGSWGEFEGNGVWLYSNESARPDSLFAAQCSDRLGADAAKQLLAGETISADAASAKSIDDIPDEPAAAQSPERAISITNGWLVCDGKLLVGGIQPVNWWRGNMRPAEAPTYGVNLTRFAPGRTGPGFTDDLGEVASGMISNNVAALDHHYGLWYDRRREDHERVRRMTGDVWAPFYEQPFARSGTGTAWDGLTKYDLTRYNLWYWSRLRMFADVCGQRGLVLFNENYFQHNVLEDGAHWVDGPWRSKNNINGTGFEEPPFEVGKRIEMAPQFYDVTNPVRRKLHEDYIRQNLANFTNEANVIQFTSGEFTGPLAFEQFWLDTIGDWEQATKHHELVALCATKDVQDAILADPQRRAVVDAICFRYWWQTRKGLFAPNGGENQSPRQFERQWKGGTPTDEDLAAMAAEYRGKFPEKAILAFGEDVSFHGGWAFACAGGSMPVLPKDTDPELLVAIPQMQPWLADGAKGTWALRGQNQLLIYSDGDGPVDLSGVQGSFQLHAVDMSTGEVAPASQTIQAGGKVTLSRGVFWLTGK